MENTVVSHDFINFVGVWFEKCGTTWLAKNLGKHPEIYIPKQKELYFFYDDKLYKQWNKLLFDRFPKEKKQIYWEFTPQYILHDFVLERIVKDYPKIKIIVILRSPVERAFSHYNFFKYNQRKENKKDFVSALSGIYKKFYIDRSRYLSRLKQVFKLFDQDQVLILFFEDIKKDPERVLKKVYQFIGVKNQDYIPDDLYKKVNYSNRSLWSSSFIPLYFKFVAWMVYFFKKCKIFGYAKSIFGPIHDFMLLKVLKKIKIKSWPIKENQKEFTLSGTDFEFVYKKFFEKEVLGLEEFLEKDLSHWKKL